DAPRFRVDVEASSTDEAAESDSAVRGELDRQARRRADGGEQRAARDRSFLHELERQPAADAEHELRKGQQPRAECPADDLVERVVAADVLADALQVTVGGEESRRG